MTDNAAHHRKLENMYHTAKANQAYNPRLTVGDGEAEVVIPVGDYMYHAGEAVHGAYYFKALDDAAYFAVASLVKDVFPLTASFNLHLLRPIATGEMKGVGKVVSRTRTQYIAEAIVYDTKDREIARGTGTFVKGKNPLTEEIGYK